MSDVRLSPRICGRGGLGVVPLVVIDNNLFDALIAGSGLGYALEQVSARDDGGFESADIPEQDLCVLAAMDRLCQATRHV